MSVPLDYPDQETLDMAVKLYDRFAEYLLHTQDATLAGDKLSSEMSFGGPVETKHEYDPATETVTLTGTVTLKLRRSQVEAGDLDGMLAEMRALGSESD